MAIKGKNIVLGISGSIAAYKGADLASKLVQEGAQVHVIMTKAATEFITPLTLRSLTHNPVITDWYDPSSELSIQHVALAETADAVVIAPATANIMAKLAHGIADDPLTGTVLATRAPIILAPAMDANMFDNPATQENAATLKERGVLLVGPGYGRLASGLMGQGRLADPYEIIGTLAMMLGRSGDLAGRRVVVSAGPTEEPIDPVRHISNPSTGKMGYAVAEAARDRGASVTLVTGPTVLANLVGVKTVKVRTAVQMRDAVFAAAKDADVLIMTAAVADYRPAAAFEHKVKKEGIETITIEMVRNPDILAEVQGNFVKIGFAAETDDLIRNARTKLREKNLDLIAANDVNAPNAGFGVDTNKVIILDRSGQVEDLPLMTKREVGDAILDRAVELLAQRASRPATAPAR
ncbi:MAG: phosphopantothenoylcysteine decarboxylase/synthetase [Dehalococcoidia bacterium]|nr:phosphopantothenoylcysteine decarboxylase/synthetase [Dehalococcoidia bacterium]